ncbi:MAG: hypothetical protein KF836_12275 [Fimbriimonadaceae bacterium]|nr:hypothetical protein [Fimbriimonadaceae bacterium]
MSIASYDIIHTDSGTEFQPTKLELRVWKSIRQIFALMVVLGFILDIYVFRRPYPDWLWGNLKYCFYLALVFALHKDSEPKPFIIDRTNQTITYRENTIPFDDLLHFTVEAATFRDKVVMVTKTTRIDLTGGLSTKKAEKLRDTLVEAIPFTLPRIEFLESKVVTN